MAPAQNITVPSDWTDHGIEGLLCTPASWIDIVTFFFSNYIAHAFTPVKYPAETKAENIKVAVLALFYPSFGLVRAINKLTRFRSTPWDKRSDVEKARDGEAILAC